MQKSKVTIKMNSAGAKALLKSGAVQGDLASRAAAIKNALPTGDGAEWGVNSFLGYDRAQATVRTVNQEARKEAAEHNALQRALGAGR